MQSSVQFAPDLQLWVQAPPAQLTVQFAPPTQS